MLKVLHGADFHLDSPFSGLKPDAAARRRGEQRELLARLTDLAREREADLVLLSGDLLDGDLVFRETVQVLARALGRSPAPYSWPRATTTGTVPSPPMPRWSGRGTSTCSPARSWGAVRLPELGCTVWGAAFCAPRQSASPLRGFHAPAEGVQLAVLHGEVAAQGTTAPSRRRTSPPAGWTTWPWAMSTSTAACAGQGRLSGLTPAAPRGVALTSWEKRACSGWRWRRGGQRRNSSPVPPEVSDPVRGPDGAGGPRRRRAGRAAPTDGGGHLPPPHRGAGTGGLDLGELGRSSPPGSGA